MKSCQNCIHFRTDCEELPCSDCIWDDDRPSYRATPDTKVIVIAIALVVLVLLVATVSIGMVVRHAIGTADHVNHFHVQVLED